MKVKFSVVNFFGNKASTASGISGDLNEKNGESSCEINVNSIQLKSKAAKGRNANGKKGKKSSETKKSQLSNSELNVNVRQLKGKATIGQRIKNKKYNNDLCGNVDLDISKVPLRASSDISKLSTANTVESAIAIGNNSELSISNENLKEHESDFNESRYSLDVNDSFIARIVSEGHDLSANVDPDILDVSLSAISVHKISNESVDCANNSIQLKSKLSSANNVETAFANNSELSIKLNENNSQSSDCVQSNRVLRNRNAKKYASYCDANDDNDFLAENEEEYIQGEDDENDGDYQSTPKRKLNFVKDEKNCESKKRKRGPGRPPGAKNKKSRTKKLQPAIVDGQLVDDNENRRHKDNVPTENHESIVDGESGCTSPVKRAKSNKASRKRIRKPEEWVRAKNKRLRNSGQPYQTKDKHSNLHERGVRPIGLDCTCMGRGSQKNWA